MTQRKPGNILIALLISSLAGANPMMTARTATKKTTITITIDGDAATDAAPATDVYPLDNDEARALAPAQAGGVIVTPAFEYSVKSSDLSTPQAAGGTGTTPATSSVSFEIKTPGRYYLASDTAARVSTSFSNTTMIYINANNVIFDMNGKTLFPNGTGATNGNGLTAIRVAPSLSNVVIKNGQINGYQPNGTTSYIANGIVVGGSCSNFTISDLSISNIGGTANTATAAPITAVSGLQVNIGTSVCSNFILQNINVGNTNTTVAGTDAAGLILYYCNNFKINSCSFC